MTSEEKLKRFKELDALEGPLKNQRDFKGLIDLHNEILGMFNSTSTQAERLPKLTYCYSRIGMKERAGETLQRLGKIAPMLGDEIYPILNLLNFFIEGNELSNVQKVTLRKWMQDQKLAEQISPIAFDHEDYL
jgi:hypothetical protein